MRRITEVKKVKKKEKEDRDMLTLRVYRPGRSPKDAWRHHFAIDYHQTAVDRLVEDNPNEVLTAIWGICQTHGEEWADHGYTHIALLDVFRDRVIWIESVATFPTDVLNGIEWLTQAIIQQNRKGN